MEQVRQLSTEREQLKNAIDEKEKENYELQSKKPFKISKSSNQLRPSR